MAEYIPFHDMPPARYYNRNRPVGFATIPKVSWEWLEQPGHAFCRPLNSLLPISDRPFGIYTTGRPLTEQELYDYEISID